MAYQIDDLIKVAEGEIGYLEKSYASYRKDPSVLYKKVEGAGSDNVTKYGKDLTKWVPEAGDTYGLDYQWCDQFVDWCMISAFGKEGAKELMHGWSAYTPTSAGYFKNAGEYYVSEPQRGDVIFFHGTVSGTFRICHTGIVYAVQGNTVYTIEGNTSGANGLIPNGGGVRKKSYTLPSSYIDGFGRPAYGTQHSQKDEYREMFAEDKQKTKEGCLNMYRMYNPNTGEHFYTSAVLEVNTLIDAGWHYERIGWYAPTKSEKPVYRLYNPNSGDHHYTTSLTEKNQCVKVGWSDEGVGWYSDDKEGVPLYREYNPNAKTGTHNYTTSKAENDHLVAVGWTAEGIGWYGVS